LRAGRDRLAFERVEGTTTIPSQYAGLHAYRARTAATHRRSSGAAPAHIIGAAPPSDDATRSQAKIEVPLDPLDTPQPD